MRRPLGLIVVVWLLIGILAAYQRGYLTNQNETNCKQLSDTLLTVVAGPLNYTGLNPKVHCKVPRPSK